MNTKEQTHKGKICLNARNIKTVSRFEKINSGLSILEAYSGSVQSMACIVGLLHEIHHFSVP